MLKDKYDKLLNDYEVFKKAQADKPKRVIRRKREPIKEQAKPTGRTIKIPTKKSYENDPAYVFFKGMKDVISILREFEKTNKQK